MLLRTGRSVRLPVRLLKSDGTPSTGIVPTDIQGGVCRLTFGNGEVLNVTLTNGVNWIEMLPGTSAPGIYHVLIDKSVLTTARRGPFQWSVMPSGGGTGIGGGGGIVGGITTTGIGAGDFVYVSSAATVSKTDGTNLTKSILFGAGTGTTGQIQTEGIVDTAKFTTAQGSPANGSPVYLALATDDSSTGAGKLRATPPTGSTQIVAEVGVVLDNSNYASLKTCRVLLQVKKPILLS